MKHTNAAFAGILTKGLLASALLVLAACSALPEKPVRATQYDFGPGPTVAPAAGTAAALPPLALAEVESAGVLEGSTAVLYRLAYADAQQLRPYALARWTMPPAQLVRQRLRDRLGERRAVLNAGESASLVRTEGSLPLVLRVELAEFTHLFSSPTASAGLVRLRATLVDDTPAGEKLLAQRQFIVQRDAPTADAAGGARALAAATDAAAVEIEQWLATVAR
ncbi:hypothetical protein RD110_01720 [Rhodoferax koreense]|uniref:ABC-type transport auxiliary lipoprotein component domain-containing protein n=1 Tax=Rhodoferax koreensis TaxID=1842727 RepID=A0A1P8JQT0_9BURK|nr:ABC-type transport auxiliary lipoprotein family protein [Rhodoferax koreense]APW36081.1 hypothetical protein RD110_01720 [Rhodoferax koreense]